MKSSLSSLVNDRKWAQRLCNMRNFFFLKISILCSRQERAYLIFCGTGTHVYGCINMVHVCMNLWLVTYLWSAHLFSFWCNSLFCIFKITTGHNIYIKFFHVHSYAFSFLLLRFYLIQSVYKNLHFIHMMYRDDINNYDCFVIKDSEIMFLLYFCGVIWCNEAIDFKESSKVWLFTCCPFNLGERPFLRSMIIF